MAFFLSQNKSKKFTFLLCILYNLVMQVNYASNKLQKSIENEKDRFKTYGKLSGIIEIVLSELKAYPNLGCVSHLPPRRRHKLTTGEFAICLNKNCRLILRGNGSEPEKITIVEIESIKDYH